MIFRSFSLARRETSLTTEKQREDKILSEDTDTGPLRIPPATMWSYHSIPQHVFMYVCPFGALSFLGPATVLVVE